MRNLLFLTAMAGFGLSACSPAPDLSDRVSPAARDAPFPELVPTAPIVAAHGGPVEPAPEGLALQSQAAQLQRRADNLLNNSVIDPATLRRLNAAKQAAATQ